MKKFVSLIIAAVMICVVFSGCSSISQESFDAVTSQNSTLQQQNSSYSSEISSLTDKNKELQSENDRLKEENSQLQEIISQSNSSENNQSDNLRYDVFTKTSGVECFLAEDTNNKWYRDSTDVFVSYLEENNYSNMSDDDIVICTFFDMVNCTKKYASTTPLYTFFISDKNGNYVAMGVVSFLLSGEDKQATVVLNWYGEYERLNSNEKHIEFSKASLRQPTQTESRPSESSTSTVEHTATIGEKNALKTAQSYLKYSSFSYSGLISQLEYEGYSYSEAKYGADHCGADWNEQAVKKARDYLEYSSFSRDGLISQLEYEGFTHSQAVYGVSHNGY